MNAATATLIAGGLAVAGTLLGVVVGLMVEYRLRRRGGVLAEARAWVGPPAGVRADHIRVFEVRFFNDRDVNMSLWDTQVEFYRGAELLESIPALESIPGDIPRTTGAGVAPIDLESRKSVSLQMVVQTQCLGQQERLKSADRVEFVATTIPGGEQVRKALTLWDDIPYARRKTPPEHPQA